MSDRAHLSGHAEAHHGSDFFCPPKSYDPELTPQGSIVNLSKALSEKSMQFSAEQFYFWFFEGVHWM